MLADPTLTLQAIADALQRSSDPLAVIEELSPRSSSDALTWARRRALWDDYQDQFPDQVTALAVVISRRAMRQLGMWFAEDGRLRKCPAAQLASRPNDPADQFPLVVDGKQATLALQHAHRIRRGRPKAVIVLSMVGKNYRLTQDMRDAAAGLRLPVAKTALTLRQVYADAPGQGVVVWQLGARAREASRQIQHLFRELLPKAQKAHAKPKNKNKPASQAKQIKTAVA